MSVRDLVRRHLEGVLFAAEGSESLLDFTEGLSAEDRGLFHEIAQGTLREWIFLDWTIAKYAAKPPRGALKTVLNLSAYQILFLDRVPDYAIFSQAAAISSGLGVSEPELKFVHAVLKSVQKNKEKLLELRDLSMRRAHAGNPPESALEWAVLNVPPPLLDALTVVEEKGLKKAARARAVRAVVAMKDRAQMVGYVLPAQAPQAEYESLNSAVAPRAVVFKPSPGLSDDLKAGLVRIQGEASQWSCNLAAQFLEKARHRSADLRVLEMTAGKGGKLLGTLVAWTEIWGGNCAALPAMEWWASDVSQEQLRIFERDTLPLVSKFWPQVKVNIRCLDWRNAPKGGPQPKGFDLVWLDAPCTGFGTLAKLPQIALTRGLHAYDEALLLAELQKTLCLVGLERVRNAGLLFYTVCTLTRPGTFGIVEYCTKETGRQPVSAQALWPGADPAPRAEGFFAAFL